MSESEADKKRNKLGYQRISVACGHCRRRKIRCVMADTDAQGRCSNCIRLGKQCVFYPVDQAASTDAKASSSSSRASTTPNISSAPSHSPQELAAGRSLDANPFPAVPSVPSNVPRGYQGIGLVAGFQGQGPEYGYRPPEYLRQWSGPDDLSPNTQAAMAGPVGGYAQSNMTNYSPFAAGDSMQSTPTDARSFSLPSSETPQQWHMFHQQQQQQQQQPHHHHHQQQQQPGRAMSYGNIEAMNVGYSQGHGYAGVPLQNMVGGGSYGLPPLDMQSASMHQATGPQSAPVSAPMMPQFGRGMPFGYQTGTVPLQTGQAGWYAAPSNFDSFGQSPGSGETDDPSRGTQR